MTATQARVPNKESPTPPFGLHEAERIVRKLAPALRAHGSWIQRIHSTLVCRTPPTRVDLEPAGHLASELGRWLADETNEFIAVTPTTVARSRSTASCMRWLNRYAMRSKAAGRSSPRSIRHSPNASAG